MKYPSTLQNLMNLPQWVAYRKDNKKPINPHTGESAKADNPATWGTYEQVETFIKASGQGYGIGFEFGEPGGYAGLDLDHVINEDGTLKNFAKDIVATMDSYTEISPSGTGLHILFKLNCSLSEIGSRNRDSKLGLEIYDTRRYFTVTGKIYGEEKAILDRTEELKQVYKKYMQQRESNVATNQNTYDKGALPDDEVLKRMFKSVKGHEIQALFNGDFSGYGSQSEADLALCSYLAHWTDKDAAQMDKLFRQSKLMRDKWDEKRGAQTYGELTIAGAINGVKKNASTQVQNSNSLQETVSTQVNSIIEPVLETLPPEKEEIVDKETVSYCLNGFLEALIKNREGKAIPTGFSNLDKAFDGGLYPGLYSIGAISSLGKTTFCLQMADNIARSSHNVLIFSLEMSRYELMAKTISRESFILDSEMYHTYTHAKTTRGVLKGDYTDIERGIILEAIERYSKWGEHVSITEGIGDIGVNEITSKIKDYMSKHDGKPPVVLIDYLQILHPMDKYATDKQNTDKAVLELKRLSRDLEIPIIGISSFNRENYLLPVSMSSFKESGAIEYSSDVLIGLQYSGWDYVSNEKESDRKQRLNATTQIVNSEIRQGKPITIQLKILKNRNGGRLSLEFEYFPLFNYFREKEQVLK